MSKAILLHLLTRISMKTEVCHFPLHVPLHRLYTHTYTHRYTHTHTHTHRHTHTHTHTHIDDAKEREAAGKNAAGAGGAGGRDRGDVGGGVKAGQEAYCTQEFFFLKS
jgi:hypothetical protein